ncbi:MULTISPECIES: RNA polymerase sigma-70 factor [Pedobacter]|uniref:RNA polymerase sigma factor n=1 Tax=Pedobacter TaxID=84567 RepID=UPI00292F0008|nr:MULTISPECIES: RNA polymerase sigma-70 factor [Pedobacter]
MPKFVNFILNQFLANLHFIIAQMGTGSAIYNNLTDRQLAEMLRDGDQQAYTEIFERYNKLLIKHAFHLLQSSDEAGDLVQDIFLILWQKRSGLVFKSSLSAYLYTAVRNRVFDLLSHQKVVARYTDAIGRFMEEGHSISDAGLRERELAELIEREIAALPRKMREVFLLSRKDELGYKEIGERLNISDQTAKLQVHNAIKILKLKIASYLHVFWLL